MNKRAHAARCAGRIVAAGLLGLLLAGCAPRGSRLTLTSYKDAYFPETYEVTLNQCAYYRAPGGDYYITGRATRPGNDAGDSVTQLLCVHVFWKPIPGKTFDNATSIDATIRYVVVTGEGVAVYSGTGYVFPRKRLGQTLDAEVDVGRLRLVSRTGEAPDLLGAARLRGRLHAPRNAARAVDIRRRVDVYAGT